MDGYSASPTNYLAHVARTHSLTHYLVENVDESRGLRDSGADEQVAERQQLAGDAVDERPQVHEGRRHEDDVVGRREAVAVPDPRRQTTALTQTRQHQRRVVDARQLGVRRAYDLGVQRLVAPVVRRYRVVQVLDHRTNLYGKASDRISINQSVIGPILSEHSGPLCYALSLLLSSLL